MPSLSSLFHHKGPSHAGHEAGAGAKNITEAKAPPEQTEPPPYSETEQTTTRAALNPGPPQGVAPQFAPGTGPMAHGQMVQANNLGVMAGGAVGLATGEGVGTGMLVGQVGANMVMQRIQQEQKHQYYREQALRYRDGLPADGVGPAGGLAPPEGTGRNRSRSRSQRREERRKARWERRAKRRDGGGGGEHEVSSGSDTG
ncbi:hypothetical protein N431DRAFT_437586 [Stipitochalara longipes BDJ]|nr:hypothetical protein N431DRAFT_437586 [Stipitochalara longipes BDJ]